jgi:hypothetical protein
MVWSSASNGSDATDFDAIGLNRCMFRWAAEERIPSLLIQHDLKASSFQLGRAFLRGLTLSFPPVKLGAQVA